MKPIAKYAAYTVATIIVAAFVILICWGAVALIVAIDMGNMYLGGQ